MTSQTVLDNAAAIIFDFDGVVVDSESSQHQAWVAALSALGLAVPPGLEVAGRMDEEIAQALSRDSSVSQQLLHQKRLEHARIAPRYPPLIPFFDAFLHSRHRRGTRLAIVSNSHEARIREICEHYGISEFFATVVGARDRGRPKPAPDVYLLAIQELSLTTKEVVAIEDSPSGIAAAKAAGVSCVALATYYSLDELLAYTENVIKTFADVLSHVGSPQE